MDDYNYYYSKSEFEPFKNSKKSKKKLKKKKKLIKKVKKFLKRLSYKVVDAMISTATQVVLRFLNKKFEKAYA